MRHDSGRISLLLLLLLLLAASLVGALVVGIVRVGPAPSVRVRPELDSIGRRTPISVEVSEPRRGLSRVTVEVIQGERTFTLADRAYSPRSAFAFRGSFTSGDVIQVELGKERLPALQAGQATLRIAAHRAPTFLRHPEPARLEMNLPVRFTPPSLEVISSPTYATQGGTGFVVYRVGESSSTDGVQSGNFWFPGFPVPGGGKQDRFAFFALPYDSGDPTVRLVAADKTGNEAEARFIDRFFPKPFRADTVEVTDSFLARVVPAILSQSPEIQAREKPIESFLEINRELRRRNAQALRELARGSTREFLWREPFLMMPNGQVMSAFADRRSYRHQGEVIDHQDHLGFDLAVTRHSPVPASNSGIVVLAKYFGIYGNTVIIDHGYGLMTLYGHLSSIRVKEGGKVARGETIGNTGDSGLAGGDHLHFTTLLQGVPVSPVEWWDGHWIRDRVASKLPALRFAGGSGL